MAIWEVRKDSPECVLRAFTRDPLAAEPEGGGNEAPLCGLPPPLLLLLWLIVARPHPPFWSPDEAAVDGEAADLLSPAKKQNRNAE